MNIIINGGTKGIGYEIVRILATDRENNLIVTGRSGEILESLQQQFSNIFIVALDMEGFEVFESAYCEALGNLGGGADILINMAGLLLNKPFEQFDAAEARRIMEVNFTGPAMAIRAARPYMKRGSHIVNISSMGGFQGASKYPGLSFYSASKAAIASLTESLAVEFTAYEIAVNCLALGAVQTAMLAEAFPGYEAKVLPGEMAKYIIDFALKGSRFFNGKILPVALSNP